MKTMLAVALALFVGAIAIQFSIKDKPLTSKLAFILERVSETIAMLAIFFFVASMAWAIVLQ